MPGITIQFWGPAAWNTLHVIAHTSPLVMDSDERRSMRTFLYSFAAYIPCPKCRKHFTSFLRRRMTDEALSGRAGLVRLLNDAHNEVNARTGKRVYTLKEHYAVYRRPRRWSTTSGRVAVGTSLVVLCLISWHILNSTLNNQKKFSTELKQPHFHTHFSR